jgi:hypothetical protein
MKASFPHFLREGGMGRISSLIHADADVSFVVGTWRNPIKLDSFILTRWKNRANHKFAEREMIVQNRVKK